MQILKNLTVLSLIFSLPVTLMGVPKSSVLAANPKVESAQSVWRTFTSTDQNFSILMPGEPTPMTGNVTVNNISINLKGFVAYQHGGQVQYMVRIIQWPRQLADSVNQDPNRFFDLAQSKELKNLNGRLLSQRNLTLNNYPGREIQVATSKNNINFKLIMRMYLANQRLYQVGVAVPEEMESSLARSSAGFLNSFKLLLSRGNLKLKQV